MRIATLGPKGTYSEVASRRFAQRLGYPEPDIVFGTVEGALRSVQNREAEYAVIAVENALDGVVGSSFDALIDYQDFVKICDEVSIPIRHTLAVREGVSIGQVEAVYSHPTALNQCSVTLAAKLPSAQLIPVSSTSEAAIIASDPARKEAGAAVCSRETALANGLSVLLDDVQDYAKNSTRFLVCSLTDSPPACANRTLMAIRPGKDMPGLLYRILGELASRQINLTFIQSRPYKIRPRDYVFILEVDGHKSSPSMESALRSIDRLIREDDGWKKILGSYPKREMEVF